MKNGYFGKWMVAAAALLAGLAATPACAPAAGIKVDVRSENRRVLIPGPGDGTIQVEVVAPDRPDRHADRPRLNLALVIDRSGSMADARKLEYVKTAAHQLVDMMAHDDVLSIVTYDDRVRVESGPGQVGRDREALHRLISGLYPGGATFLSGGLEEGFRQAEHGRRRGYVNRVLLLSDGLANRGVTSRGELRERAATQSERGISVSTFGVGHDFDEELMATVAAGGGGNYRYLGDPETIVAALSGEFRLASRIAASDVEIVIRLRRDCRFGSIVGREWRRDGDAWVVRLGDLSSGERRTVFANLNVGGDRPGVRDVGDVSIRYRDPATAKTVNGAPSVFSMELVRDERAWREGFDREVQGRRAVAESNVHVQNAARLADQGRRDEAKALLGKAEAGLAAAPPSPAVAAERESAAEYRGKLDELGDMNSPKAKAVQKSIKYRAYETLQQR
jgi:Ca-activated chloride channel family protein